MVLYNRLVFLLIIFFTTLTRSQEACADFSSALSDKRISSHLEEKFKIENRLKSLEKRKIKAYCLSAVHLLTGAPISAMGIVWIATTFDPKSPHVVINSLIGAGLLYYGDKILKKGFHKLIDYHHQKEQLTRELKNHETSLTQLTRS